MSRRSSPTSKSRAGRKSSGRSTQRAPFSTANVSVALRWISLCRGGHSLTIAVFHGGRTGGHNPETGVRAVSSSSTRVEYTLKTGVPGDTPDEMTHEDIKRTIADFVRCAKNCMDAGMDGVEIQ